MSGCGPRARSRGITLIGALSAAAAVAASGCGAVGTPGGATRAPSPAKVTASAGQPELPPSFDPARDITDLTPITRGLRLGEPVNGMRHGELVLTIRNNGPAPVSRLMFTVEVPESMSADGGDWAGCTPLASTKAGYPAGSKCDKGYIAAGQSRVFHLGMKSPADKDGSDSRVSRWLTDVWSAGEQDEQFNDLAPEDNRKIFSVYRD